MKKLLYLLLIPFFIFSCGSLNDKVSDVMKSWVGNHKSKLIQSWGPPTKISTDGKGGEVYTYLYDRKGSTITSYNQYTNQLYSNNYSYTAERNFYIDSSGKIYSWRWKGR